MQSDSFFQKIVPLNLTPLQIRQSFQNILRFKQIQSIIQKQDYKDSQTTAEKIIKCIQSGFYQELKEKTEKFCKTGNKNESFKKTFTIYLIRQFVLKNKIITNSNIFFQINQQSFDPKFILQKQKICNNLFEISYYLESKIKLTSKFQTQYFLQITKFVDDLFIQSLIENFDFKLLNNICGNINAVFGYIVQGIYRYLFMKYDCLIQIKQTLKKGKSNKQQITSIIINQKKYFLHFSSKLTKQSVQQRLKDLITKNNTNTFASPRKNYYEQQQQKQQKENINSKCFDFLISKYIKQDQYVIYSFDVTKSDKQDDIYQNKKQARKLINKIFLNYHISQKNNNQKNVKIKQWRHFIVGKYQQQPQFFRSQIQNIRGNCYANCKIQCIKFSDFNFYYIKQSKQKKSKQLFLKLKGILNDLIS